MRKISAVALAALLLFSLNAFALGESDYESACNNECSFLTKDCTAYVECRVARTTCTSNCMQRKVWEKVVTALDSLTAVLEKQAKEKEAGPEVIPSSLIPPRVSYERKAAATNQTVTDKGGSAAGEDSALIRVE